MHRSAAVDEPAFRSEALTKIGAKRRFSMGVNTSAESLSRLRGEIW
jgi:hypothetical protein